MSSSRRRWKRQTVWRSAGPILAALRLPGQIIPAVNNNRQLRHPRSAFNEMLTSTGVLKASRPSSVNAVAVTTLKNRRTFWPIRKAIPDVIPLHASRASAPFAVTRAQTTTWTRGHPSSRLVHLITIPCPEVHLHGRLSSPFPPEYLITCGCRLLPIIKLITTRSSTNPRRIHN